MSSLSRRHTLALAALALCLLAAPSGAPAWTIRSTGQDPVGVAGSGAAELSGLVHAGGTQYYAVADGGARVFPVTIAVHPSSGQITDAAIAMPVTLTPGVDLEGIVLVNQGSSALVSDESGPAIRRHDLATGALEQTLSLPAVFSHHRSNLSLESLALQADGSALWTANEEALTVDGPVSGFIQGTIVRLQRFDASLVPSGQWAYVTDAIPGDFFAPGRDIERSGVSELVVLPNGALLVLERALGAETIFRSRLYLVDFAAATDTSALSGLAMASYVATSKTLLWQEAFSTQNFEGAALGPRLHNGDYSLVLVSDDGGGLDQTLLALRVSTCDMLPRSGCRTPGASRLRLRSAGNRSQLSWSWRKGTVNDTSVFGDPSTSSAYALCIYETEAGVARLAASARIDPNSAWRSLRTGALRYRDRTAGRDGISGITLKPGNGKAKIVVSGRGPQLRLPPSDGVTPLLSRDPTVTVQLVNQEAPNECFESTYSQARVRTPNRFEAGF